MTHDEIVPAGDESGANIIIVSSDVPDAGYCMHVLRRMGGYRVRHFEDPETALRFLEVSGADLVMSDLELAGMTGLELLRRARKLHPGVPVILMSGNASVESAVEALRERVDDFLLKPVRPGEYLEKVHAALVRAGAAGRERVLAVGAHPDDVEIGAGGTLRAHRLAGDAVTILTMSGGGRGGDAAQRRKESRAAAEIIDARLILEHLEDTRIPEGNPTVSTIEHAIADVRPTILYVHSANDVHQDHRNVHAATMVAARRVPYILCFQSPSGTIDYRPTRFVDIERTLDDKLAAIRAFGSQTRIRDYLDEDVLRATARYWARFGGGVYAEPFEVVRDRRRPGPARSIDSRPMVFEDSDVPAATPLT